MILAILFSLKSVELLKNRLQPHSGATPLFSVRMESQASSQSCRSIDTDAWCKWALSQKKLEFRRKCGRSLFHCKQHGPAKSGVDMTPGISLTLKGVNPLPKSRASHRYILQKTVCHYSQETSLLHVSIQTHI